MNFRSSRRCETCSASTERNPDWSVMRGNKTDTRQDEMGQVAPFHSCDGCRRNARTSCAFPQGCPLNGLDLDFIDWAGEPGTWSPDRSRGWPR